MQSDTLEQPGKLSDFFDISEKAKQMLGIEYVFYEAMVFIHIALVSLGMVPVWTFCIAVFLYIPRWMICLHEMQHQFTPRTINPITRLNLLTLTPLQLGYSEMRDIHMRHHAYSATPKDPEYYHIKGHWFMGWVNVMFSPEQSTYFWLKTKDVDKEFIRGVSIRFLWFFTVAYLLGDLFLWYLIPVRLAYGSCLYFFSYWLHRRSGEYGTFSISYPTWLTKVLLPLYGQKLIQSVSEHDIHHDYPRIPGFKLTASRPYYTPRGNRTVS